MNFTVPSVSAMRNDAQQVAQEKKQAALEAKDAELVQISIAELYEELGRRRESMSMAQLHAVSIIIVAIDEQVQRASEILLELDGYE